MQLRQRGFTLIEAIVALAVLGVLLGLGAGAIGDMVHAARLRAVAGDVLQHVTLARSEAIKRNGRVVVCKSANGMDCRSEGGWEQGWILFHDRNNTGTREPGEPLVGRLPPLPEGWRVRANGPVARYVSYGPMGVAQLTSGAFQAGTFTVCRASAGRVEGRQIVINAGGRPRVQSVALAACS